MTDLAKLNRLRVNAGKPELKSWKASKSKLAEAIKGFEDQGFTDVLPGANVNATPVTEDPEVAKNLPSVSESAMAKNVASPPKEEPKKTKGKASLARGLESDNMARNCRASIQKQREQEKKKPKGQVDPKKDPQKAERQQKHIEEKRAAREAAGKLKPSKEKSSNEITVAEIARELGLDPKLARAKLRRHEAKIIPLHTVGQDRWTFPIAAKPDLITILK